MNGAAIRAGHARSRGFDQPVDAQCVPEHLLAALADCRLRQSAAASLVRMMLLALCHAEVRARYPRALVRAAMAAESVLAGGEFPPAAFYR